MIEHFRNKIRLRWRFGGQRYSITVGPNSKETLNEAQVILREINRDIKRGKFDTTLSRYKKTGQNDEDVKTSVSQARDHYKNWLTTFGNSIPINVITTGNMLYKWGPIQLSEIPDKMSAQKLAPVTFNMRLNILRRFCKWLQKKEIVVTDPLSGMENRRGGTKRSQRRPFDDDEIKAVLDAFRNNTFSKSNTWPHNHYYPFLRFMTLTGVRNAEAIGLQISRVNLNKGVITIDQAFARTIKGDNAKARILKGTKTSSIRYLPLTDELREVLTPLCAGRKPNEFVFTSHTGNPINDRMFQQRFFKPVLKELGIEERDLYALRHTFGTIAIEQGFTPLEAGYLMGHNNPKTILEKYAHLRSVPTKLPKIP